VSSLIGWFVSNTGVVGEKLEQIVFPTSTSSYPVLISLYHAVEGSCMAVLVLRWEERRRGVAD
jgi:hypothetical protein